MKTIIATLVLGAMLAIVGCRSLSGTSGYPRSLAHPTDEYPVRVGDLNAVEWIVCTNETDAELVLVFDVTIPEILNGNREEFPIRRVFAYDAEGNRNATGSLAIGFNSDGVSKDGRRGIGYGGSYLLDSQDGRSMLVKVSYYWTNAKGARGNIQAQIPCLIGIPDEWALSETARLKITYRMPRKGNTGADRR